MWSGFVSIIKRLDLLSFFCEELCRFCGCSLVESAGNACPTGSTASATLCRRCYTEMRKANRTIWWLPMSANSAMTPFAANHYDPHKIRHPNNYPEFHDGCCDTEYFSERIDLLPIATGGRYEGQLQKLIRRLKYDDDLPVVRDIGPLMCDAFELLVAVDEQLAKPSPAVAVPVPLHPLRKKQRGYNQAELLAGQLCSARNLELKANALRRKRETRPQYGLTKLQRSANVCGAFMADPAFVHGRSVVLVDDVFTSGATLRECARALKLAGAVSVSAVAAAMAPLKSKC
jgi:ComF family protein